MRRRQVSDFASGAPSLAGPTGPLRLGRPAFLPVSSLMCVRTDERVLALTFDDGPVAGTTPGVLDALAAAGVRATFFVLADRADEEPALVRRMVEEGHEVGLHGEDHARLSPLPVLEAVRRIRRGRRRLEAITGRPVTLFRPAYGAQRVVQALATRALGLEIVIWTAWATDWEPATVDEVADRAAAAVHPGAVLLLHDATEQEPGAEPGSVADPGSVATELLARLRADGYRTATVGELVRDHRAVRSLWFESARTAREVAGTPHRYGGDSSATARPRSETDRLTGPAERTRDRSDRSPRP